VAFKKRPFEPSPNPGLRAENFHKICLNGFGDGYNAFSHSMAWCKGHLYVGTTRANFQIARAVESSHKRGTALAVWPVQGPDTVEELYRQIDRRAHIWRYNPLTDEWKLVFRSPEIFDEKGLSIPREMGYRGMVVYQGETDPEPTLYVSTWAPSKVEKGSLILRLVDSEHFEEVTHSQIISNGSRFPSQRVAIAFKDRVFFAPTGSAGNNANRADLPLLFTTRNLKQGPWEVACEPGFGDEGNTAIIACAASEEHLYAGTYNLEGYQVWMSDCSGDPPFRWKKLLHRGAYRGPYNQIASTLSFFKGALYVGSSIQGGGYDSEHDIGPAGSELVRVFPDGQWDVVVGERRETPDGFKEPLSFLGPGFGSMFNGYFWWSAVHDGWLYIGTCNINSLMLYWVSRDVLKPRARKLLEKVKIETIISQETGAELWRSADGENWIPVTRRGFNNPYNIGFRSMASTPHGLFVGTANPFGPEIAVKQQGEWTYIRNSSGGTEVWYGTLDYDSRQVE
jgi:hypothetical protein